MARLAQEEFSSHNFIDRIIRLVYAKGMQKKVFGLFSIIILLLISSLGFPQKTSAETYPCQKYSGSNECIDFSITSGCNGTSPYVKWDWTGSNLFGNTKFTIVYSRNGNWYIKDVSGTSWTMTNPPFGGGGSGGTDNTALKVGEYISGKLSGGYAPNITTGYTNPDKAVTVKSCIPPTATSVPPTATITPSPTPSGPPKTTVDVTFHVEGLDQDNFSNVIPRPGKHGQSGWPFTIYAYSGSTLVKSFTDTITETVDDPTSPLYGTFHNANFDMTGLASGTYKFYVSTPMGTLRTQIGSSTFTITGGKNNVLVTVDPNNPSLQGVPYLTGGDITGDNQIDIQDYNILVDCYGSKATSQNCQNDKTQLKQKFPNLPADYLPGDVNDNGIVDGIDYNTLLRGPFGQIGAGGVQN